MISFSNTPPYLNGLTGHVSEWLNSCAANYDWRVGNLAYTFHSNDSIKELNARFLDHNYPTDIITFDYSTVNKLVGELHLGINIIEDNASSFGTPVLEELCRVMVHGILHMMGFSDADEKDKDRMRENEDKCLLLRPKILNDK